MTEFGALLSTGLASAFLRGTSLLNRVEGMAFILIHDVVA
jgi:hypothetical protein